ncbi:uncharacterized protein LOC121868760 [Homarus americanus]|uniref:NACHT-NTPase and P-loop NTPases N-terminal domain-containing protein n=1 Tax=Homarus americanus TaxID=6706 RepID=A0A8J5K2E9_HOMAM|nr:uncharacterized protein LOC121868760 [Homarus americanus]KAG7167006.1 hypothetical protein Hamer_G005312 [Homarus americanus]
MFFQVVLSSVCLCACAVKAVPQSYGVLEVSHPEPNQADLGPFENMVSATIDVLPEIREVFQRITSRRDPSADPVSLKVMEDIIMSFLPITEKILKISAKAEGRELRPEELERLDRTKEILPAYFRLMNDIAKADFPTLVNGDEVRLVPAAASPPVLFTSTDSSSINYGQKLSTEVNTGTQGSGRASYGNAFFTLPGTGN